MLGYEVTGFHSESRKPYGVLVEALQESEWELFGDLVKAESAAGSLVETRLMFEDQSRSSPVILSTDSYKIRTCCLLRAGVSPAQLEEWLAIESDGKQIPPLVRDHIIRLVTNRPESEPAVPGFVFLFDEFYPGREQVDEASFNHWFDEYLVDESEYVHPEPKDDETVEALKSGEITEETYEDYICVCFDCLIRRDFNCGEPGITPQTPNAQPHHPPPYLKFRF